MCAIRDRLHIHVMPPLLWPRDVLSMRKDDYVFSVKLREKAITVEVLPRPGHPNVTGLSNKPRFLEKLP